MRDPVRRSVEAALQRADLRAQSSVVVGVSGGTDSLVLMHVLLALAGHGRGPTPTVVHVDHGLRTGSADEARAVVARARALGAQARSVAVDVSAWDAIVHQGPEAAARAARYAALARVACEVGTDWVVLGHNRDDQAETVLLHLARGTGLDGLAGMREVTRRTVDLAPDGSDAVCLRLLRPLLTLPRSELSAYACAHGLEPIEDPSNRSLAFRRNAVRRQVLPALEAASPGASAALARGATLLRDDADLLSALALAAATDVLSERGGLGFIARDAFREHHPALQRRVLRLALEWAGMVQLPDLERVEALRAAVLDAPVSNRLELGAGFAARVDYAEVAIGRAAGLDAALRRAAGQPLIAPGTTIAIAAPCAIALANGWRLHCRLAGQAGGVWVLRTRRGGDRLQTSRGATVRLQDWLVDRKVPGYLRDWLPLIDRDGLVRWVAAVSPAESVLDAELSVMLARDDAGG